MIDARLAQKRLRDAGTYSDPIDGDWGARSYQALLEHVAGRVIPIGRALGLALNANAPTFGMEETPERLAGFVGQCCHESGGFRYLREIWGPTPAQLRYEGRADLGNTQPGDGKRYMGRGLIQITGRANYRRAGQALGLPLEAHPELAETPDVAVLTALTFWRDKALNILCDARAWDALTRKINGGMNGAEERRAYIAKALEVLND